MKKYFLTIFIVIFIGAVFFILHYVCPNAKCGSTTLLPPLTSPTSFADCVSRGFPVTESNPRQCRAGTRLFTEEKPPAPVDTEEVSVFNPLAGSLVKSPLTVTGTARGAWYFEASFPIRLLDARGKELVAVPARAKADWMTQGFVPFEAVLTFAQPTTSTGTLVLRNDNPSGDPAREKSVSVPVLFSTPPGTIGTGIKGEVTFGPTCPAQQVGDASCSDKPYQTAIGIFKKGNTKTPVQVLSSGADGKFITEINPGSYVIQARGGTPFPKCVDKAITVTINEWINVALECDSGIR